MENSIPWNVALGLQPPIFAFPQPGNLCRRNGVVGGRGSGNADASQLQEKRSSTWNLTSIYSNDLAVGEKKTITL